MFYGVFYFLLVVSPPPYKAKNESRNDFIWVKNDVLNCAIVNAKIRLHAPKTDNYVGYFFAQCLMCVDMGRFLKRKERRLMDNLLLQMHNEKNVITLRLNSLKISTKKSTVITYIR